MAGYARQLAQYRAALDGGGDPAVLGPWITEAQARKLAAEARIRAHEGKAGAAPRRLTREEIATMVNAINDVMTLIRDADAASKAELYAQLGLHLTYNPAPP